MIPGSYIHCLNVSNSSRIIRDSTFHEGDKVKIINLKIAPYNNEFGIVEAVPGKYISSPKHYVVRIKSFKVLLKEENLQAC